MAHPTLAQVVEAIASEEPLERAAVKLGVTREELVSVLREAVATPVFRAPAKVRERLLRAREAAPPDAGQEPSPRAARRAVLYVDGASRGNPGPAGAGAVLTLPGGESHRLGRFLGVRTNNHAEYQGVLLGLAKALELGVKELDVRGDSMLTMMQLKGEWKLRNEGLRPLYDEARSLARRFAAITFRHIPREENQAADEMSNRAIDERM